MTIAIIRRLTMVTLVFGLIAAGCAEADNESGAPNASQLQDAVNEPANPDKDAKPAKKDLTISSNSDSDEQAAEDAGNGSTTEKKPNKSKPDKKEPAKLPNYNVNEPFDTAKPTLMGITIGDSLDAVTARFGKPVSESTMNDGQTLTVFEYPGFIFGASENKSIVFIEVTTDQITPGLNQFRVGQTVEQAQKALGAADSLNEFVMIYQFEDLVLKCDLDPNTKTVISIKLFAA